MRNEESNVISLLHNSANFLLETVFPSIAFANKDMILFGILDNQRILGRSLKLG